MERWVKYTGASSGVVGWVNMAHVVLVANGENGGSILSLAGEDGTIRTVEPPQHFLASALNVTGRVAA